MLFSIISNKVFSYLFASVVGIFGIKTLNRSCFTYIISVM